MSKLLRLYEMPRPAGTWSAPLRAALQQAKEYGKPFTVKDFAAWMQAAGGATANPMSVGPYIKRLIAPKKPDALHPLAVHMPGRRGVGGAGMFVYALDPAAAIGTDPMPRRAPRSQQEPTAGDEPGGEFSSSDDEDWNDAGGGEPDVDAGSDDLDDEPEDEPAGERDWIPRPDAMGSYAESSMEKLAAKGLGPESDFWERIAGTTGNVDAHNLIRKEVPIQLQRPALAVAKQIFQNLEKDWDSNEGRSLSRLYRIAEATVDDEVPSPEKRGRVSVDRALPNYGMDEAQLDPVDFAVLHGIRARVKSR